MSTPPADLQEGKAEGHYRLSCMKILELQCLMSFCVGECTHVQGGWCTAVPQGQKLLCSGPFWTLPYVPFHLGVHLYLL